MNRINQDILESGILIVDDEHNILKALRRLINRHGFTTVNTALNAEQGLTIIQNSEKPFAVILSDQHMPGVNGYAFLNKVKEISPDSRRILMTGYHDFNVAMDAINQGGIHKYISKPWEDTDLLTMLTHEIELFHSIHEKRRIQVTIKNQNAQLYQLARQKTLEKKKFKEQEAAKKEQLASIKNALDQLKKAEDKEKVIPGLDHFFADKQIQDQTILIRAFEILNREIDTILTGMARKHNIAFSSDRGQQDTATDSSVMAVPDYDLIDQIIGIALQNAMPRLTSIHRLVTALTLSLTQRLPTSGNWPCKKGWLRRTRLQNCKNKWRPGKGSPPPNGHQKRFCLLRERFPGLM